MHRILTSVTKKSPTALEFRIITAEARKAQAKEFETAMTAIVSLLLNQAHEHALKGEDACQRERLLLDPQMHNTVNKDPRKMTECVRGQLQEQGFTVRKLRLDPAANNTTINFDITWAEDTRDWR